MTNTAPTTCNCIEGNIAPFQIEVSKDRTHLSDHNTGAFAVREELPGGFAVYNVYIGGKQDGYFNARTEHARHLLNPEQARNAFDEYLSEFWPARTARFELTLAERHALRHGSATLAA